MLASHTTFTNQVRVGFIIWQPLKFVFIHDLFNDALSGSDYTTSSKLTQAVMLHTIIWEMRSSNLTLDTHYPGWYFSCLFHWSCGLRSGSAVTPLRRMRVRIPPGTWMSVSCECYMPSGRGLCDGPINRREESYRVWCV